MRSAKLYLYQIPMDSGVILRDERLKERVGYVVQLSDEGRQGYGEIAPLPGFSHESLDELYQLVIERCQQWIETGNLDYSSLPPSAAFGLSMAQMELTDELPKEGNYHAAPLCSGDPDELLPVLEKMSGDKVAKIKVGLYEPIRDGMIVNLFLESIPELKLRLDANRAWTLDKARKFAEYIAPSLRRRISFIEEPCQQPSDSFTFAIETGIAIAWDETLQDAVKQPDFRLADLTGAKSIVIKPTLIGSVPSCVSLIEQANALGIRAVLSSSLESSLGLTQIARLAHWKTPLVTPGLDTLGLFQRQLELAWPGSDLPVDTLDAHSLIWQG
ncbi:o-succinylbenzoate synthase [Vibrio astriarenae]|uniref:o-succinylbenzoate synthase n=1 Tax=Vibrio astriarenae TaxID=1481923 RepID=UPI003736F97C